jgi:hypothetical protein
LKMISEKVRSMTPPVWLEVLILFSEVCIIVDTVLVCAWAMLVTAMSDIRRIALRDKFFMIVFLRVMLIGDAGDAIHRVLADWVS